VKLWRGVTNDAECKTRRRYEALLPDTHFDELSELETGSP
jgi:hypothetical protein